MTASDDLRDLCERYWEYRLTVSPLFASFLGDHRFDDRADDLSEPAEDAHRQRLVEFGTELGAIEVSELDCPHPTTQELLCGELTEAIQGIDARLSELMSDQMQGVHADLLTMVGQLSIPEAELAPAALTRISALAAMLDQATDRFRSGLARGRTPARINIDRSINQIDGYLASSLEHDPFANITAPTDWDGEDAWRRAMADEVRTVLRPAFERYRQVLAAELAPVARPDEQAGLCWIPGGYDLYRTLIRLHTGLDLDPDELHQRGLHEVTEVLPDQYREAAEEAWGITDLRAIFDRLLGDPDLRYRDGQEILDHAQQCLDDATAAMDDWFGILPVAPCQLTPVPDFLAADAPAAYYTPPAPDGSRPGEYHVNLHNPTERGRAETASIAFHEAIPGHHLQLAIAAERPDLPAFRRLSWGHTAFVEGWALYTERLADEMGLYRSPIDRLGMLASDSWRACRLVVDTGLHAMGWSRQRAIDFMVEHAPVSRDEIETEVDRYIGMPGQALAYKVGQHEILRLRAEAEARLGERFSLPGFHDIVLGGATVSLAVLDRRVQAWTGG